MHGRHAALDDARLNPVVHGWEGGWTPVLAGQKSFIGTMASDIGSVPADGGGYLQLLMQIRVCVEKGSSIEARLAELHDILRFSEVREWSRGHGGPQAIYDYFFPPFLTTVKGLQEASIAELWAMQLNTPNEILEAGREVVGKVKGIGPSKLEVIWQACLSSSTPDCAHVDNVNLHPAHRHATALVGDTP